MADPRPGAFPNSRRNRPRRPENSGRPKVEIDWELVKELCRAGCSGQEIADNLDIHSDTLYNRTHSEFNTTWSNFSSKYKSAGDSKLRSEQYLKATGKRTKDGFGDNTMLLLLGKHRLNQWDIPPDNTATEQTIAPNQKLMNYIDERQSEARERKMAAIKSNEEAKSKLETEAT